MKISYHLYFLMCALLPVLCEAQKHDTLQNVEVISKKNIIVTTTTTPVQLLNTTDASKTNSLTVADALKHFAGVTVKDYGGIGGLKTVSIRSLGANHTGIFYDGIAVGDAQGGQIDVGKFMLDNITQIELYNSGPVEILSPAKAFSYGSLIMLKTTAFSPNNNNEKSGNVKIQYGSFGYFSPSISYKQHLGKKIETGFNAMYQSAQSQYPFTSYENSNVIQKRKNSDIKSFRFEFDASINIHDSNKISIKTYYYKSDRGLPGAIILYNDVNNERLNDRTFFIQSNWHKKLGKKSELLVNTKYATDQNYYVDPSFLNYAGKLENEFYSKEFYLSAAYSYKINNIFKISLSTDVLNNQLKRTDTFAVNFPNPSRNSLLNNVAFQIKKERFELNANVLYTVINEKVTNGKAGRNFNAFSEAIAMGFQPIKNIPLRVRAFYKHVFRAPTFNDMYYTNVGNTNLKPEYADQFNAGLTFYKQQEGFLHNISITADAFLNTVNDKIIAVPTINLFQWSVQNIGHVNTKGIDVAVNTKTKEWKNIQLSAQVAYSFQEVLDVTDKNSSLYKTQLPYTPKHSGSSTFSIEYKRAILNYNVIFSSHRYKQGDAIFVNLLQPWNTNDVSFSYSFGKKYSNNYKIILEANNIFNTQYDIIKYYPMPGFNYRISLNISFKKQKQ
ncbi:MAG: TonB-dependent receptor [Ferruginibacter sp.]|nr:TonB-dependent receptor [Ferruginibacter sp.]